MDSLAKKTSRRHVREAAKNLPEKLDEIYDEAMRRIEWQDHEDVYLAKQILCWISFAFRPLTVAEIQHALAVRPGDTDIDEEAFPDEELLVSVCVGLVTIEPESNIIRLVHYTTQQYFDRVCMNKFPDAQISIASTCLTYLSLDIFAETCLSTDQKIKIWLDKYCLFKYAAWHWGEHARKAPEEGIKQQALKFLQTHSKRMCLADAVLPLGASDDVKFARGVSGLHIAASFGLVEILRLLVENG